MSSNTWAIIINPQSGASKTKKRWREIDAELRAMVVFYGLWKSLVETCFGEPKR